MVPTTAVAHASAVAPSPVDAQRRQRRTSRAPEAFVPRPRASPLMSTTCPGADVDLRPRHGQGATMSFARQSLGSLAGAGLRRRWSACCCRASSAPRRAANTSSRSRSRAWSLAVAQWGIPEVLLQLMADGQRATGALIGTSLAPGPRRRRLAPPLLGPAAPAVQRQPAARRRPRPALADPRRQPSPRSSACSARRFIQLGGRLDLYNGMDVGRTLLFLALAVAGGVALPRQALGPTIAWLLGEIALAVAATRLPAGAARPHRQLARRPSLARELATLRRADPVRPARHVHRQRRRRVRAERQSATWPPSASTAWRCPSRAWCCRSRSPCAPPCSRAWSPPSRTRRRSPPASRATGCCGWCWSACGAGDRLAAGAGDLHPRVRRRRPRAGDACCPGWSPTASGSCWPATCCASAAEVFPRPPPPGCSA